MIRKSKRIFVLCIVFSMLLSQMFFTSTVSAAASAQKARLYGTDRVSTAIEISKAGWKNSSDYAILVTASNFPDALCAAPLAKLYNAPLLLTDGSALNAAVKTELQRLNVKNVIIVGGTGVVSDAVFNTVKGFANVQRIAGTDREETSVEVAKKLGTTTAAVLATGLDFPDALSISSIAASKGMPILLTGRDTLNDKVDKYLKDYGISTTYIVGGTGAISTAVEAKVPGPVRMAGSGRVQTNYEILNKFASSLNFSKVYVATALDFPDALAGSALAAMSSSPIILADGPVLTSIRNLVKNNVSSTSEIIGLGGTAVVSDYIVDGVVAGITGDIIEPGALGVETVNVLSRNYFKVVYSQQVDEVTAESANNYLLDGVPLSSSDKLVLESDRRTVSITLDRPMDQHSTKLFIVKDRVIFSEDSSKLIPKYEKVLTFTDANVPQIKTIAATGDKLITIEFSEPVMMPAAFITAIETSFKLNGQYLANYGFNSAKVVEQTPMNAYSNKLELSFNTGLPLGVHTLSIPSGSSTQLVDAAGFALVKTDTNLIINSVTSVPRITKVTGETNGTLYVTYDRVMDATTAEGEFLYYIGSTPAMSADFVSGSENKIVKVVFGANVVKSGANILIADKDIKDLSGNFLATDNDVKVAFNASNDNEKPRVLSVNLTDEKHIKIKFSEPIEFNYATEKSNYTLIDVDGFTVSYISSIASDGGSYSDIFTITLNTSLSSTGYKLRIKNLVDRATTPNVMDDYETAVNGTDNVAPTMTEAIIPDYNSSQVVIFFSEAMDVSSTTNKANLTYKDNSGNYHELPSGAAIEAGIDKKSITITFPTGYTVKASGWVSQYDVKGIRAANVKDLSGNLLTDVVGYKDAVNAYNAVTKPSYISNSFKLYPNGDNVRAEFELTQALAILRINDFRVAGQTPDSGFITDKKVTLNFTDSQKVTTIRLSGADAQLSSASNGSANVAGVHIEYISTTKVYDDLIPPVLLSTSASNGGEDTITLRFSEKIDDGIPGLYLDDFVFMGGGTQLNPIRATINYDTVIYYFAPSAFDPGSSVIIRAVVGKSSIRDLEDESKNRNTYRPSLDDIGGLTITAQ